MITQEFTHRIRYLLALSRIVELVDHLRIAATRRSHVIHMELPGRIRVAILSRWSVGERQRSSPARQQPAAPRPPPVLVCGRGPTAPGRVRRVPDRGIGSGGGRTGGMSPPRLGCDWHRRPPSEAPHAAAGVHMADPRRPGHRDLRQAGPAVGGLGQTSLPIQSGSSSVLSGPGRTIGCSRPGPPHWFLGVRSSPRRPRLLSVVVRLLCGGSRCGTSSVFCSWQLPRP